MCNGRAEGPPACLTSSIGRVYLCSVSLQSPSRLDRLSSTSPLSAPLPFESIPVSLSVSTYRLLLISLHRWYRSRTRKVVKLARKNWLPRPSLPMDRYLIPWVPTMSMVKGRKTIAVPACDLVRAREEYEQKVLASASTTERRRGRKALFAVSTFVNVLELAIIVHIFL